MQIKSIIFDCGRVFLHDSDNEVIFHDIAKSCGITFKLAEKVAQDLLPQYQTGQLTDQTFWQKFQRHTYCSLPEHPEVLWIREYLPLTHINHEVLDLVKQLRNNGYKTPVLSNTIPPHVRINRSRNLFQFFQPEIFSCEVGAKKPDKRIYQIAAERSGAIPEECVFIDDVLEYVKAAQAIGMKGIQYQNLAQLKEELRKNGVRI